MEILREIRCYIDDIIIQLKEDNVIDFTWNFDEKTKAVDKVDALVDVIGNLGEQGFNLFLTALDTCNLHPLSEKLRREQQLWCGSQKMPEKTNLKGTNSKESVPTMKRKGLRNYDQKQDKCKKTKLSDLDGMKSDSHSKDLPTDQVAFTEKDGIYEFILYIHREELVTGIRGKINEILTNIGWDIPSNVTPEEKPLLLLDIVGNHGEEGFRVFLSALDHCLLHELSNKLRKSKEEYCGVKEMTTFQKLKKKVDEVLVIIRNFPYGTSKNKSNTDQSTSEKSQSSEKLNKPHDKIDPVVTNDESSDDEEEDVKKTKSAIDSYVTMDNTKMPAFRTTPAEHDGSKYSTRYQKQQIKPISFDCENMPLGTKCTIGSLVEVDNNGKPYGKPTGIIKWIGYIKDPSKLLAGLEMDLYANNGNTDTRSGKLNGYQQFKCLPGRGLFVDLKKCSPDSRFNMDGDHTEQDFGLEETPDITGSIPIPACFTGKKKGIQGHQNSCYLDSTLFAMFAFNDSLDFLFDPLLHDQVGLHTKNAILSHLKEGIINPLRQKEVVRADKIMKLRQMLEELGETKGLLEHEKDPEEFILLLLQHALKEEPFLAFNSGQETFLFNVLAERDKIHVPTTQKLFNASCCETKIKLKSVPKCLILQLPRSGKNFKMYEKVYLSPTLKFNDVLDKGGLECIFCNSIAETECEQCPTILSAEDRARAVFCSVCSNRRHAHTSRSKHTLHKLEEVGEIAELPELELFAVLCISLSHYVAFVKTGRKLESQWVLFDSMADREGELDGYNIPEVSECKDIAEWLNEEGLHRLVVGAELNKNLQRFFGDPYMCFYRPIIGESQTNEDDTEDMDIT